MKKFALLFVLMIQVCFGFAQTLHVNITGIRNTDGNIRLVFYTTSESFDKETPSIIKTISKTGMVNGNISVSYSDLKPGTYGVVILDDENKNLKMDYGLILPKEGFGFSDYYHTGMSKPRFEQFDFVFGTTDKTVQVKVKYM
jgi:uncharacterized protein (DUF2141 family)